MTKPLDEERRRREAQAALGGEKLVEREQAEEKRRREAILAMEGEKHRSRREEKEAELNNRERYINDKYATMARNEQRLKSNR